MLVLQKFNSSANGDNDDSLSYIYSGDFVNNVTFNVTTLKQDLMNLTTARVDEFCLQTTFYFLDVFQNYGQQNGTMNLTQLSEVTAQVNLNWDENRTDTSRRDLIEDFDLKSYITLTFPIKVNLTQLNRTITNYTEVQEAAETNSTITSTNLTTPVPDNTTTAVPDNTSTDKNTISNTTDSDNGSSATTTNSSTTDNSTDSTRRLQVDNSTKNATDLQSSVNTATTNSTNKTNITTDDIVAELVDSAVKQKIVCMAFSRKRQLWDESMCKTDI